MDQDATIEDIAEATRARSRMYQKMQQEVLADTFTMERYVQLYTELQETIKDLHLPSWWRHMEAKAHQFGMQFFDSFVFGLRETIEKRGITTDDMIEEHVRARVGRLY